MIGNLPGDNTTRWTPGQFKGTSKIVGDIVALFDDGSDGES